MAKDTSNAKNWLRGGQIVDHNIRMFKQTAKKVSIFSIFFAVIFITVYVSASTTTLQRKLAFNYYYSYTMNYFGFTKGVNRFNFNNQDVKFKHHKVVRSAVFIKAKKSFNVVLISALIQAVILIALFYFFISIYIRRRGKEGQSDKFLRGGSITNNKAFKKSLNKKQINKSLGLGSIPIIKDTETMHLEISGSTGTGKSQTLKHLIRDIKKRGDRAVIYSSSTEFITEFYDAKTDVILNPLDDRSQNWMLWNETQEVYHYDDVAASIIPEEEGGQNDPFWIKTARSLLSNAARKLKDKGDYSTKLLYDKLLSISLKEIANLVKNTESATIFADGIEKTALGVRSTLLSNLASFKFLRDEDGGFSIRDWVKNEDNNHGCVFITSIADQHEVLKPLISCWVDVFASSILSLSEDRSRRIWLIIDELPSLHKLKSLEKILAESRKYGGCVVLGYQSYSKVESVYGDKGAKTLSDLTATKVFFRSNDQYNAKHSSDQLGKEEIKTTNENISMGAHQGRDSISIAETEKLRELVLPTQIVNLENLHGFYRLPGDHPIVSFNQTLYKAFSNIKAQGFIKSTKNDHIYMLEGKSDEGDDEDNYDADENAYFNEIDLGEVPDYIAQDVPLDNQQHGLNFSNKDTQTNTIKETPKKQIVEQKTSQINANITKEANVKSLKSIMLRGL